MLPNLHVPSDVPTLLVTLSSYFCILVSACLSMSQPLRSLLIVISGVLAYISATSQRERA